jgi:hypothetical protein
MNEGIIKIVMKIHLELSFYQSALRRHSNSKQQTPGKATAPNDPNSFGLGYEYSHTGDFILQSLGIQTSDDLSPQQAFHHQGTQLAAPMSVQ